MILKYHVNSYRTHHLTLILSNLHYSSLLTPILIYRHFFVLHPVSILLDLCVNFSVPSGFFE